MSLTGARYLIWVGLLAMPGAASAGGLDVDDPSPRSVGRAGATLVSDDGEGALATNPAGLARRSVLRVRVGASVRDSDLGYAPLTEGSPTIQNNASATTSPSLSIAAKAGPFIIGAAYLEPGLQAHSLRAPGVNQDPDDVAALFPHRYGGTSLHYRRRTGLVGGAIRLNDFLGLGASLALHRATMTETRQTWAGFAGRDELAYPAQDLGLELEGNAVVPEINIGSLIAPESLPIEVAVAVAYRNRVNLRGDAHVFQMQPTSPTVASGDATARATLPETLTIRGGIRYLGDIIGVEADVTARMRGSQEPPTWRTSGLTVTDTSGVQGDFGDLRSAAAEKNQVTLQGAVDAEIVEGFLALTAGYRYRSQGTASRDLSPIFNNLATHTMAFGAEGYWEGITFTVGYARTLANAMSVGAADSDVFLDNPFDGGTAVVGQGVYDQAADVFGISAEIEWP